MLSAWLGTTHAIWSTETARVHHAARRHGGRVAARGAFAANHAGRIPQSRIPRVHPFLVTAFGEALKEASYSPRVHHAARQRGSGRLTARGAGASFTSE